MSRKMKSKEVWIVKMENEHDESEFDRFMFPALKDVSKFLREYLPASGCFSGDIDKFLRDLERDAYEFLYAHRDLDEGGIEVFTISTAKPIAKDYIIS
jgi:hypothetical protein